MRPYSYIFSYFMISLTFLLLLLVRVVFYTSQNFINLPLSKLYRIIEIIYQLHLFALLYINKKRKY